METAIKLEERIGSHLDNGNIIGEIESPSRRKFLKGLLAVGILGPAALSQDARAQRITVLYDEWYKELPPGIGQCRDRWVQLLYAFYQGNIRITNADLQLLGRATPREGRVRNSSWFVEPAVYFPVERGDASHSLIPPDHIRDVMGKTPQMAFFSRGIAQYISFWDVKRRYWSSNGDSDITRRMRNPQKVNASSESVEENFVNSIFCSAYPDREDALQKAKTYLGSDIARRTQMADEIASRLNDMGASETTKEDNRYDSPYNRNLCALWSSVWLANHYNYGHKGENINIAYRRIEGPIQRYMKGLRGPPWYYDSTSIGKT